MTDTSPTVCTPKFKTALLFLKPVPEAKALVSSIEDALAKYSMTCHVVENETDLPDCDDDTCLGLVVGGDGTFLLAARWIYGRNIPLIGINFGTLGFLTEIDWPTFEDHINTILCGSSYERSRPYFLAEVKRGHKVIQTSRPFVNEAAIHRNAHESMVQFTLHVGERTVTSSRGDGVLVSTPTGSTAYNLSTGGPILYPTLEALVIAPICPHTLSFRPVVVPQRDVLLTMENNCGHLSLDGQNHIDLEKGDEILIQKAPHSFRVMHSEGRNFFKLLRQKLGWDLDV